MIQLMKYSILPSCALLFYYNYFLDNEIEIMYHPSNKSIVDRLTELKKVLIDFGQQQGFRQTIYLPNAFSQIFYGTIVEQPRQIDFSRQLFKLSDGGIVALDWLNQNQQNLIIITHGLTGGSEKAYIREAARQLAVEGFTVVCFNQRGVSSTPLLTPQYHSHGDYSDLQSVIESLSQTYPDIYAVGISIGANLIMKYAGSPQCRLKGVVSIANPFNLQKCSDNIMKWENYIYNQSITFGFKQLLQKHKTIMQNNDNVTDTINDALNSTSTYEFDDNFTRRLLNFSTVQELYDFISCDQHIVNIEIPVLCVNSKDDPIVPYDAIPFDKISKNKNIIFVSTKRGGHIEWFTGLIPQRVDQYFLQFLVGYESDFLIYKDLNSNKLIESII